MKAKTGHFLSLKTLANLADSATICSICVSGFVGACDTKSIAVNSVQIASPRSINREREGERQREYEIASADGAEAIDDIDEDEAGVDVAIAGEDQRILLHRQLLPQQLNRRRHHLSVSLSLSL